MIGQLIRRVDASPTLRVLGLLSGFLGTALAFAPLLTAAPETNVEDASRASTSTVALPFWVSASAAAILIALFFALTVIPAVFLFLETRKSGLLRSNHNRTIQALHWLARHEFERKATIKRASRSYHLEEDGTCKAETYLTLVAPLNGLAAYRFDAFADPGAAQIATPEDIDLRVRCVDSNIQVECVDLEAFKKRRSARWLLVFSDRVEAGQEVKLRYTFKWKGFASELINSGRTTFFHFDRTTDGQVEVQTEIHLPKKFQDATLTRVSPHAGGTITCEKSKSGVTFRATHVSSGHTELVLELPNHVALAKR